jgi:hypothetical protein
MELPRKGKEQNRDAARVGNSMNRFAVSSRMPINYNSDLSLAFRSRRPFNLCMRMYAPKGNALTGRWSPPEMSKIK